MYWGEHCFLLQLVGQAKELGGQLIPSLYGKRGPGTRVVDLLHMRHAF